jgi:hypothetical protein
MAAKLKIRRIHSASLAISLVVTLAVLFDATAPARAGHFLTHPAGTALSAPSLAAQAVNRAGARSAAQTRALNATQNAAAEPSGAATLFKNGAEIGAKKDANIYLTPRSIPDNDRFLKAYNADRPDAGRAQAKAGEAAAVPGLLGIANQTIRGRDRNGQNNQAYSLADAMRDAIWRKTTAARLRSLTTSMSACAKGAVKKAPSIGLAAVC